MDAAPNVFLAFGAGLLSFLSPCCLPLYPSYVSYITGLSAAELAAGGKRARQLAWRHASAFSIGFSVIFIALGVGSSLLGAFFVTQREPLRYVGGALIIVMGLVMLGVLRIPFLMRDARLQIRHKPTGYLGSVVVGISFAAGWTPCIGPILAAVLTLAANFPGQGILLLLAYSVGFAIPFLALAYVIASAGSTKWLMRYSGAVERVGGVLLIAIGVLLISNQFTRITNWLINLYGGFTGF